MTPTMTTCDRSHLDEVPDELLALRDRIRDLPDAERSQLEPFADEVIEQARFRTRVLTVARGALEQLQLDLQLTRFDLDVTRRERQELLRLVRSLSGEGE